MHYLKHLLVVVPLCLLMTLGAEELDLLSNEQKAKAYLIILELENNEDGASNPINENSPSNADNPNALTDSDNDNMPDALELKFGGNPSNANDAQTSLDAILLVDRYTINEISDLRLGSTLYEVSEGLASFNIILEETSDLTTWTPYGEYSMELSTDGNEQTKFYRFKMSE